MTKDETVVVDKAAWDAAQKLVARMPDILRAQAAQRGAALIDDAIRAGKFPPARRAHWVALFDSDPVGTEQVMASLASGTIPMDMIGAASGGPEFPIGGGEAYPAGWLNKVEKETMAHVAAGGEPPRIKIANDR